MPQLRKAERIVKLRYRIKNKVTSKIFHSFFLRNGDEIRIGRKLILRWAVEESQLKSFDSGIGGNK